MELELLFPLVPLYAEIHFRFFRFFPSALFRPRPEVVFDVPFRIESRQLPLCLIIHDVAKYPTELKKVAATISTSGQTFALAEITQFEEYRLIHGLSENTAAYLFPVDLPEGVGAGPFYVNAFAEQATRGRSRSWSVLNDNLPTSSRRPLSVRYSPERLPGRDRCVYGDIHMHSQYSESHVEFGPPVEMISRAGGAAGLDFVGITDHSYDLACRADDYLTADPHFERWNLLKEESEKEYSDGAAILRGEEVSTLNARGRVVHLGGLGFSDFIPGSLDGARPKRNNDKQLDTQEVATEIARQGGISFAAHPGARPGFLQRFLLRRGSWTDEDLSPHLHGFQGANGGFDVPWERARRLWIQSLLQGRRYCLLAGSDAHGDFSRYRSVGIPFVSIHESFDRHMGYTRTGVYAANRTRGSIADGIRAGKTFITSGPYLSIDVNETPVVGERFFDLPENLSVIIFGSEEFGRPFRLRVYRGICGEAVEKTLTDKTWKPTEKSRRETIELQEPANREGYLRAEALSRNSEGTIFRAYTSAVFFGAQ